MTEEKVKQEEKKKDLVLTRGRTFQGKVVKKFDTRVAVEFERTVKIQKYERFAKKKTRLHARIDKGMNVHEGDHVKVRECRPLSKLIHFKVIEVIRSKDK